MTNRDSNARLDKMGQWAAEVNEWRVRTEANLQMLLNAKIKSIHGLSDDLAARLGEALDEQAALPETISTLKIEVSHLRQRLGEIGDDLDVVKARGMLGCDGRNVEVRAAQLALFVAEDDEAAKLKSEQRELEHSLKVKEAQIEELEMKDKHIGRLCYALTAELQNITARLE